MISQPRLKIEYNNNKICDRNLICMGFGWGLKVCFVENKLYNLVMGWIHNHLTIRVSLFESATNKMRRVIYRMRKS